MKKITAVLSILVFTLVFTSCKDQSLQAYLVSCHEKPGFVTVDVPVNFLQVKDTDVSEDVKETINSIHKVNLVALPYKGNEDAYKVEKETITTILKKSSDYKSLFRMNVKGMKVSLYYSGDADAIDEVIAFGYADEKGVGVARILGENMNPGKIIQMVQNISVDSKNNPLSQFGNMF